LITVDESEPEFDGVMNVVTSHAPTWLVSRKANIILEAIINAKGRGGDQISPLGWEASLRCCRRYNTGEGDGNVKTRMTECVCNEVVLGAGSAMLMGLRGRRVARARKQMRDEAST